MDKINNLYGLGAIFRSKKVNKRKNIEVSLGEKYCGMQKISFLFSFWSTSFLAALNEEKSLSNSGWQEGNQFA